MTGTALFIRHKALPGMRDEVRRVWEKHLPGQVSENPAHLAYFYCYDDTGPDTICVFQLYSDAISAKEFVRGAWYPVYEAEVSTLLAGQSEFRSTTPVWIKGAVV